MTDKRKDDSEERTWFRTKRLFQEQGLWYFHTREGTLEGPFASKEQAESRVEFYIKTMSSRFAPPPDLKLMDDD